MVPEDGVMLHFAASASVKLSNLPLQIGCNDANFLTSGTNLAKR